MNKKTKAHLALLSANIIYAASFTIAKQVTPEYIKPFGFVLIRAVGAAILFWVLAWLTTKEKTVRKDFPKLIVLAMFGVTINQMLFIKGLSITTPIDAAIMMVTTPILVLIIASIIIKERITLLKLAGIVIGFSGAANLMLDGSNLNIKSGNLLGDLFVFINALSWGTYIVLVKPFMKKYKTVTILKWTFLFGAVLVFPFGINELAEINWETMPSKILISASFIVFATTFLAYLLNIYSLNELSPSVVSAYIYLQPLLATAIALAFGKDQLSVSKIVSAVLIFAGVYLVSIPVKKESIIETN